MKKPDNAPLNQRLGLFELLTSMKFALLIVLLIALACAVGTLLPQGAEVADYLEHHPAAARRMEWLTAMGLTNVFESWWFLALLGILCGNLLVCVTRQLFYFKRAAGGRRLRLTGTILVHLSLLAIFLGGLLRGLWAERGFIEFREGESAAFFSTETGRVQLPFTIQLLKFEIERYPATDSLAEADQDTYFETLVITWPERKIRAVLKVEPGAETPVGESFRVRIVRRIPDFVVDTTTREITSRSAQLRNPAILVQVSSPGGEAGRWVFARYPDFNMHTTNIAQQIPFNLNYEVTRLGVASGEAWVVSAARQVPIKSFKSTLLIQEGSSPPLEKTIEVNSPLSYGGYTFYQSGYNENDPTWTSLQVVRDPGVAVVYLGFALLTLGLLITTYSRAFHMTAANNESRSMA